MSHSLWGEVVRGAGSKGEAGILIFNALDCTKIRQLSNSPSLIPNNENILGLEIPVDDPLMVHFKQAKAGLGEPVEGEFFRDFGGHFAPEIASICKFKHNAVDFTEGVCISEIVNILYDARVIGYL